jgi:spermidine synthase
MTDLQFQETDPFAPIHYVYDVEEIVCSRRTEYQQLLIVKSRYFGKVLVLDGVVQLTERDEHFYHEMLTQVALHAHPHPADVLIIGGGDGGSLREVLKHKAVKRVQVVELDRGVIDASREFLPTLSTGFADPRAHVLETRGEEFMAKTRDRFDLVIMDAVLPDGDGPTLAREIRKAERSPVPIVMLIHIGLNVLREPSVSGWLTKPVKPLQLQKLIASLLSTNRGSEGRSAPERSSQSREARFKNLSILLAEDNPINQKVALSMLKHLGYRAEVAANGVEVLQALRRQPFDIVLMDIQMPEMDGLEATHRIREINGRQPFIIAMTAYALDGDREECLKAGMDEYIRKPIQMEDLQKALERFGEATKALE